MTIGTLSETAFVKILQQHLRPSSPVDSYEHLYGRERQLEQIKQAMYSPGRQVFIYGDRGVGKTSLAKTAAYRQHPADGDPVFVACGVGTTFKSIVSEIMVQLRARSGISEKKETTKTTIGLKNLGVERTVEHTRGVAPAVHDFNSATEALKSLTSTWPDRAVVVVDEFDQLKSTDDQRQFAELIKQLGDQVVNLAIIFCGIGKSLDDLLASHGSSYRYLEGIELPRLNVSGRWEIIDRSSEALGIRINADSRFRIQAISDGFPHYVHLVCEKLYWNLFQREDMVIEASPDDYMEAVRIACASIESHLRQAYDKATMKDNDVYEEVLWALADHFELQRNVDAIYRSYLRIMDERKTPPLDRKQFVSRLNNLKSARHGAILCSGRRSWYEFSENMVRGYVRLRAEDQGVRLAIEHEPSAEMQQPTVGAIRTRPSSIYPHPRLGGDPYRRFGRK
jgi:AAA+ ATPase superfamily predicted ATPase